MAKPIIISLGKQQAIHIAVNTNLLAYAKSIMYTCITPPHKKNKERITEQPRDSLHKAMLIARLVYFLTALDHWVISFDRPTILWEWISCKLITP